ncbi:hypothetical protein COCON_G00214850 [Conger conger]|uniref:Chemokine interleukin-8-like domain-containing protein n=1 Tax=Conger conger TaxID=82655 RepID=A0A9Q1CXM3_CONCO|nr:hypothetical protein COCON_G00214850 [Conger conger]
MMKIYISLALVMHALILNHGDAHPIALSTLPENCCFRFFQGNIPSANIVSVRKIYSGCLHQGFIVHTIKNRTLCMGSSFQLKTAQDN